MSVASTNRRPPRLAGNLRDAFVPRALLFLLGLHVAIALVIRNSTLAATAVAFVTLAGAGIVVLKTRQLALVASVAGYLAASEVLWRMTGAGVFWQASEFAVAGVLGIALVRLVPHWRRTVLPIGYLAVFIPGVVLSVLVLGLGDARDAVSFNVSAPLALAVSVLFFTQVRATLPAFRQVLWATVLPIVSVAVITTVGTATAATIFFTDESNFTTSGGFGPNQVSSALGFGAVALLLLAFTETSFWLRLLEGALALWLLSQAMLTFSRGGVLNVVVAMVLALLVMARHLRSSARPILILVALGAAMLYLLYPRLDQFTGNALSTRFADTTTTQRNSIAAGDVDLFWAHPWVGAGIGVSAGERPVAIGGIPAGEAVAAHTEYTRLLAEQGLFGLLALVALLAIAVEAFWRARPPRGKVLVLALAAWSFTDMAHAAMRLSLVGFSIGLAVAASRLADNDELRRCDPNMS